MTYQGLKVCPQCNGAGECTYEEEIADYEHGGYLEEVIDTCNLCEGTGELEDWGDDE
jgi:DnaJ-class molecular chaperone